MTRVEHAEQWSAGILGDDRARRVRVQERSVDIDPGVHPRFVEEDLRGGGSAVRMTEHPDPVGIDGLGETVRQQPADPVGVVTAGEGFDGVDDETRILHPGVERLLLGVGGVRVGDL
nr:hypothetical protein [Rhodococcus opacus]